MTDINSIIEMIEGMKFNSDSKAAVRKNYSNGVGKIYNEACEDIIEQLRKMSDEIEDRRPDAKVYKCSETGTGIDIVLLNDNLEGEVYLYAGNPPSKVL